MISMVSTKVSATWVRLTASTVDMLEEFSAVKVEPKAPAVPQGKPAAVGPSVPEPKLEDILSDDEFAKQLQAGMADLLGEMGNSVSPRAAARTKKTNLTSPKPEMQAQFDSIFKELGAATVETAGQAAANIPSSSAAPGAVPGAAAAAFAAEASFQETIKRTMERMQTSGDQATAAAAAEGSDDFLAELLKQMQAGGLEGEGNEEDFSKMLLGMMEQLTNKEILYEPMKELNDKFPEWFEKNKATTSKEDLKRYQEQQGLVKEIVAKFEESTYSDANAADREYIVDRMQKVCTFSPLYLLAADFDIDASRGFPPS